MKRNIIVKLEFESVHSWPECPFPEVEFLQYPHRHNFHILCKKEVKHNDREIEIIILKREILSYLDFHYPIKFGMGRKSCEDLAQELFLQFGLNYCSVLEDNENGAEVYE